MADQNKRPIEHNVDAPGQPISEKKRKKREKNLIYYPLGTIGRDMMYYLFTNCILTYILFTKKLTASQLMAITGIMIAARVFDALNDPIMGNIIERTRTKWGKFKPWLLAGVLSTSVVIYLAFNTNLQGWNFIIFFGFIYFAYSITYTMHDISYWGMIPALSRDADLRNQYTSRATFFAGVGSTLASVLIPIFTTGGMALGGNAGTAYGTIALIIAVLGPLFILFTLFGVKEYRGEEQEEKMKLNFRRITRTIKQNDQLRWMILIFLLQQIGNALVLGGIGSSLIYFRYGYEGGLYSIFSMVGVAATAVLMIIYPALSRKFTRRQLMSGLMLMVVIGSVVEVLGGLVLPANTISFILLTIGYMIVNLGLYGFYLIMMISIINTVEYNQLITGHRNEAIITSMRPLLTKMGSAIVVALTSLTYLIFHVTEKTNAIAHFEQQAQLGAITDTARMEGIKEVINGVHAGQTTGLMLAMVLIPLVFGFISYLLYQKHYKLDEKTYEDICAQLEAKKA
ncbi:MAG: glycoside-pentoside-hexuronide (GPH):cation symporter [Clostridiales bacterium]|nr:glycoside-pentoside-hexuronide (GPH):cation symporter [Clostridiales bacterium]